MNRIRLNLFLRMISIKSDWFLFLFHKAKYKMFFEFQSESIKTKSSIRMNPIGSIRGQVDSDWKLCSYSCLRLNRINLDWFLTVFHQTRYKMFIEFQSKSIQTKLVYKMFFEFQSESIQTKSSIRMNPIGSIRGQVNSDWKLSSYSCRRLNRINLDFFLTVFHQTRYKISFGLVRNNSYWSRRNRIDLYRFLTSKIQHVFEFVRNDSECFG